MQNLKKRKKKQIKRSAIKKSFFKIVAVLLLVGLNHAGLLAISNTKAYFNDEEITTVIVSAATLDFSVSPSTLFSAQVTPTQKSGGSFGLVNDGSLNINYNVIAENFSGDSELCNDLLINVNIGGSGVYSGKLSDFNSTVGTLSTTTSALLDLEVALSGDDAALKNKACNFDLNFSGWQADFASSSQGFAYGQKISSVVSSGSWTTEVVTPTSTPTGAGDVVINEIMWMGSESDEGSNKTGDEWLELRNMTDHEIDIGQWKIENIKNGDSDLMIPASRSIPANGYFLIANNPKNSATTLINVDVDEVNNSISLFNTYSTNGAIILKGSDGMIIDQTPSAGSAGWPAGKNVTDQKWSMERNLTPGNGMATSSWHTCDREIMDASQLLLMQSYWKASGQKYNCGTPKNPNLSKNDPTADDFEAELIIIPTVANEAVNNSGLGAQEPSIISDILKDAEEEKIMTDNPEPEVVKEEVIVDLPSAEGLNLLEPGDTKKEIPEATEKLLNESLAVVQEPIIESAPPAQPEAAPGPDPLPPSEPVPVETAPVTE